MRARHRHGHCWHVMMAPADTANQAAQGTRAGRRPQRCTGGRAHRHERARVEVEIDAAASEDHAHAEEVGLDRPGGCTRGVRGACEVAGRGSLPRASAPPARLRRPGTLTSVLSLTRP